jgi:hypothetical protein
MGEVALQQDCLSPHQAMSAHLVAARRGAQAARRVEGHACGVRREGCVGAAGTGRQSRLRASGQKEGRPGRDAVVQASVGARLRAGEQRGPPSPGPAPSPMFRGHAATACGSLGALGGCCPNSGPHHDGDVGAGGLAPLGGRAHIHRQGALPGAVRGAEGVHLWQGVAGWSAAVGRQARHARHVQAWHGARRRRRAGRGMRRRPGGWDPAAYGTTPGSRCSPGSRCRLPAEKVKACCGPAGWIMGELDPGGHASVPAHAYGGGARMEGAQPLACWRPHLP